MLVERDAAVTIISINRPERRNAVDGKTALLLFEAFHAFDNDEHASVAVFTGTGSTFCAGADLKAIAEGDMEKRRDINGTSTLAPMGPTRMRLSKPVIAAIEGYAVAGGMELALWADLRVMAEDATFGVFCRRFGVPLSGLGTIRLPRLIGQSRAMDLILTGRPVGAAEAFSLVWPTGSYQPARRRRQQWRLSSLSQPDRDLSTGAPFRITGGVYGRPLPRPTRARPVGVSPSSAFIRSFDA